MQTLSKTKEFTLTAKQEEALSVISALAKYILLYGGSRSAKTFFFVRAMVWRAIAVEGSRHAILRFRFNSVKRSIVFDTFPKVMALCFPDCPHKLNKEDWFVKFPNGAEIWFGGLDDKERTEKILGNEYATILLNEGSQISYSSYLIVLTRLAQKCFYERDGKTHELRLKLFIDENPPPKGHWTHKLFIEKKSPIDKTALKTPELYDSLLMNPSDNIENIADGYLESLDGLPKMQRDRFFLGKFADESENALWSQETLDANRVNGDTLPEMVRIVVPVDPSGAGDNDNESNDAIGIGVIGLGADGLAYVFEDLTLKAGPKKWGGVVSSAYERHKADRVVGESNFGGAMVEFVVKAANPNISYKSVCASRGKTVRAEPVSALHESGKIKFIGRFDELEDELLSATTTGYVGQGSPNRMDWFVWGITELFPGLTRRDEKKPEIISIPSVKRF